MAPHHDETWRQGPKLSIDRSPTASRSNELTISTDAGARGATPHLTDGDLFAGYTIVVELDEDAVIEGAVLAS